jgi:hypothetical protein
VRDNAKSSSTGGSPGTGWGRCLALALTAAFALLLTPALASAADPGVAVPHFKENLGSAAEPTFGNPEGMAVDQASGDIYVVDAGNRTVSRWHADGTPSNFSALSATNVIDGHAGEADATPKGEILYGANNFDPVEVEIAVDNSGTATDGNLYVTFGSTGKEVDIFASNGEFKGSLTFSEPYVCGVAVDPSGAVYVGASENGTIYKYVPSGAVPVNADKTAEFTGVTEPCQLAAGAGPTAGYLFAASYSGALKKLNSSTGEVKYTVSSSATHGVTVDPSSGHVYQVHDHQLTEYDASGAASAAKLSEIDFGGLNTANGAAVDENSGHIYATHLNGAKVEIYAPYTVKVNIAGTGEGRVSSVGGFSGSGFYEGNPAIECHQPSQPGDVCETAIVEEPLIEPGLEIIYMRLLPAPGSELTAYTFDSGTGACAEEAGVINCGGGLGGNVELTATFNIEPEHYALNLSTSGSGSGTFECEDLTAATPAAPCLSGDEFVENHEVKVIPVAGAHSVFAEFNTEEGAEVCDSGSGSECVMTMSGSRTVNANFTLETFPLSTTPINTGGTGSFQCDVNGGGLGPCPAEVTYGDEVEVVANAGTESEVNTISGAGSCSVAGDRQSGTCVIASVSGPIAITAEFVSEGKIKKESSNVYGEVDIQTTLATENCDNLALGTGKFVPSNAEEEYSNGDCVVTVTATGAENELRAADETGGLGGTDETGHLTQEGEGKPFTLNKPLEVKGNGTTGGASPNPSGFLPLSSSQIIQNYSTPVSLDVVTVTFLQKIEAFEPLHTGTYSKTITLTLEQTAL